MVEKRKQKFPKGHSLIFPLYYLHSKSADPVAELVKAGVFSHSILSSAVRLSASVRPPILRNYFSEYFMLQ